jgi:hypothetical protein
MSDPDWTSEPYDPAAAEDEAIRLDVPDPAPDRPALDRPSANGIALRWCALLAVLALAAAGAGGFLLDARRSRTVTSTVVGYQHPHGVALTGCPWEDVCEPLPGSEAGLTGMLPPELAGAKLLAGNLMLDSSDSSTIRTLQVLTADRLTLAVASQCVAGAAAVPSRDTEPTRAADGSTELALVRPGQQPGCSVALVVRVPAGQPVPSDRLRRLADELPQRLVDNN